MTSLGWDADPRDWDHGPESKALPPDRKVGASNAMVDRCARSALKPPLAASPTVLCMWRCIGDLAHQVAHVDGPRLRGH